MITAPVLHLNIWSEAKRLIPKVLINKHIERLKITGPCTFNIYPVMENLKEINLTFDKADSNEDCCTYFKSKIDDRKIHRQGLCVLNLAAAFENCPKLEKFMGIDLTSTFSQENEKKKKRKQEKEKDKPQELTFSRWSLRVKKLLYEEYTKQGGTMEMKHWSRSRWVSKKPVIPAHVGVQRVANALFPF